MYGEEGKEKHACSRSRSFHLSFSLSRFLPPFLPFFLSLSLWPSGIGVSGLAVLLVAGPERQVVSQQLHDERGVLVGVLVQIVQVADGLVERLLGQLARLLGRVLDLVVEDGEVERQAQADGVRGGHALADLERLLVGALGGLHGTGALLARGHLGQVAVVVALHLQVEHLALHLGLVAALDEELVEQVEDILTHGLQLLLDGLTVGAHQLQLLFVAVGGRLLLDAGGDTPGRAPRAYHVLVGHRQQVAVLVGEWLAQFS
ncbi:hypothetical protein AALO_G00165710, partial [Alosa alosa]